MLITDEEYDSFFSFLNENCEKLYQMYVNKDYYINKDSLLDKILKHLENGLNMFHWSFGTDGNLYALIDDDMKTWTNKIYHNNEAFSNKTTNIIHRFDGNSLQIYNNYIWLYNKTDIQSLIKTKQLKIFK